jgi:hypothetical protein
MMRRGPGLLGAVARTAVVAGTATVVSDGVRRRQANRAQDRAQADAYEQQQQQAEWEAQQAQAAAQRPAAPPMDMTAKLKELAELKAAGVLTDEEFAAAKAKLLS